VYSGWTKPASVSPCVARAFSLLGYFDLDSGRYQVALFQRVLGRPDTGSFDRCVNFSQFPLRIIGLSK